MHEAKLRRACTQELTDRLIAEYAGSVPPGQVLAAVVRAQRIVAREGSSWAAEQTARCELLARHELSDRASHHDLTASGG